MRWLRICQFYIGYLQDLHYSCRSLVSWILPAFASRVARFWFYTFWHSLLHYIDFDFSCRVALPVDRCRICQPLPVDASCRSFCRVAVPFGYRLFQILQLILVICCRVVVVVGYQFCRSFSSVDRCIVDHSRFPAFYILQLSSCVALPVHWIFWIYHWSSFIESIFIILQFWRELQFYIVHIYITRCCRSFVVELSIVTSCQFPPILRWLRFYVTRYWFYSCILPDFTPDLPDLFARFTFQFVDLQIYILQLILSIIPVARFTDLHCSSDELPVRCYMSIIHCILSSCQSIFVELPFIYHSIVAFVVDRCQSIVVELPLSSASRSLSSCQLLSFTFTFVAFCRSLNHFTYIFIYILLSFTFQLPILLYIFSFCRSFAFYLLFTFTFYTYILHLHFTLVVDRCIYTFTLHVVTLHSFYPRYTLHSFVVDLPFVFRSLVTLILRCYLHHLHLIYITFYILQFCRSFTLNLLPDSFWFYLLSFTLSFAFIRSLSMVTLHSFVIIRCRSFVAFCRILHISFTFCIP